jgi:hypothetical protein
MDHLLRVGGAMAEVWVAFPMNISELEKLKSKWYHAFIIFEFGAHNFSFVRKGLVCFL